MKTWMISNSIMLQYQRMILQQPQHCLMVEPTSNRANSSTWISGVYTCGPKQKEDQGTAPMHMTCKMSCWTNEAHPAPHQVSLFIFAGYISIIIPQQPCCSNSCFELVGWLSKVNWFLSITQLVIHWFSQWIIGCYFYKMTCAWQCKHGLYHS